MKNGYEIIDLYLNNIKKKQIFLGLSISTNVLECNVT